MAESDHEPASSRAESTAVRLCDLVGMFVEDCEAAARAKSSGERRGPTTGIESLDEVLCGFLAPGIHLLQAAPAAGKSALLLQIASDCGFPALFVTTEMPILELVRRLVSRQTGEYLGKFKAGEIDGRRAEALFLETARKLPHLALMDASSGRAAPQKIADTAAALREDMQSRHVLVVMDSLQWWARQVAPNGVTEYDAITHGVIALDQIAKALRGPVLASVHRSRQGQAKGGMHAAKGTGDLEYGAESILELERGEKRALSSEWPVTLSVHKNRHGEDGMDIPLMFEGRRQTFREGR